MIDVEDEVKEDVKETPTEPSLEEQAHVQTQETLTLEITNLSSSFSKLNILFSIAEIVSSAIILTKEWDMKCSRPLHMWLIVYCSSIVLEQLSTFRYPELTALYPNFYHRFNSCMFLFSIGWWIVGQVFAFAPPHVEQCRADGNGVWWLTLLFVLELWIILLLPLLFSILLFVALRYRPRETIRFFLHIGTLSMVNQGNRGVEQNIIDTLPKEIFQADSSSPPLNNNDCPECSICMSHYVNGDEQRILPCKHRFHCKCVDLWLRRNATCPLCRGSVVQEEEDEEEEDSVSPPPPLEAVTPVPSLPSVFVTKEEEEEEEEELFQEGGEQQDMTPLDYSD